MGRAEYLERGEFWTRGNSPTIMEHVYSNHYGYIILNISIYHDGYSIWKNPIQSLLIIMDISFWIFNIAVWIYPYGEEYGRIDLSSWMFNMDISSIYHDGYSIWIY
jgi:hypothetical protein